MPGIVKVKILEGRNLPVMDRSADTTDAYVELKLGSITYKSDVYRKSLNPQWNTEWYKFEMADVDLQDEPLQVRVMDYDTYSANDLIGKVYFNLNPLLLESNAEIRSALRPIQSAPGVGSISGWFPIYDTINGLRGEIHVIIKVDLFSDFNKFRQSSCGVHIFSCSMIPHGYYTENIYGFVEELVVEDDPEYQWIEKIRSPRASNEARQAIFYKMSGVLQRKIGMKVVEMGGNAIIGYRQCFDLEAETGGVVVRGIGTAVKLYRYKKVETIIGRNSFYNNFIKLQIPDLTITSAFGPDANASDACSVVSLSESLRSDRCLSELVADDRWSLCSFASRASCNSRYTSIETLLEQSSRTPAIAKSGSRLLNVARYFTSSRLRRKFSKKQQQQKSILLLRKFSVIEEYKQKGGPLVPPEEAGVEGASKPRHPLERMATVEERTATVEERTATVEERTATVEKCLASSTVSASPEMAGDSGSQLPSNEAEGMLEEFVKRLDECIVSDEAPAEAQKGIREQRAFSVDSDRSPEPEVDDSMSGAGGRAASPVGVRCRTPPISEMIPYSMSPPVGSEASVKSTNGSAANIFGEKPQSIGFERQFLRNLRRQHVTDYFCISNSPHIRRLALRRQHSKSCGALSATAECCQHMDLEWQDTASVPNVGVAESDGGASSDVTLDSGCNGPAGDSSHRKPLEPEPSVKLEPIKLEPVTLKPDNEILSCPGTNEWTCNVGITTADDGCKLMPEALTRSRLLMHANNPDRNISEGDKEEDAKREPAVGPEAGAKNRSLSDTGGISKYSEGNKDSNLDKDSVSSSLSIDSRGHNVIHRENLELMEYPFLTLSTYPEDFIIHIGGTVSARSVKLLDRISNPEEPETRDAWWTELRIEIKSHMRALACNAVLNYTENTSICEEICLLSATGTAALVKVFDSANVKMTDDSSAAKSVSESEQGKSEAAPSTNCSIFHIPYRKSSLPFPVNIRTCNSCRKGFVADVTFLTIEPQDKMPVVGQSSFIHAFVFRPKRDCKSEMNAREISDGLPFLEYELNRQLINKLRIKGMNALFGLSVHVSVGEKMIAAYATGTAVLLSVLPPPPDIALATHSRAFLSLQKSKKKLDEVSKLVEDTIKQNKVHYQLIELPTAAELNARSQSQNPALELLAVDQYPEMEYFANAKQTCVIEIDDEQDLETIAQLIDPNPPQGFFVSATEKMLFGSLTYLPKKNIQLFAQVYRYRIPSNTPPSYFNKYFQRIVQALYMKIHHRIPCSLNKVSFKINIPDSDELQIRIVGMALALKESDREMESMSTSCSSMSEIADDTIFGIDGDKISEQLEALSTLTPIKQTSKKRDRRGDVFDTDIHITSLSYIPGGSIAFYLGNLNFVFIRESSMSKEHPGGANNFVSNFLADIVAVVKSHAVGIGGNAVVNFFLNECLLTAHSHKNQCQCLMHVGGDIVRYAHKDI